MNSEYLYRTEQEVILKSNEFYGLGKFTLETFMEIFFNSSHFLKEKVEQDTDEHVFHIFAYYNYMKLPYTLRSIIILWGKGYYLESNIIMRSILEGLLQIKYFFENKNLLKNHILNKKRISIKTMFNVFLPNQYDRYYGRLLSGFAHSGLITSIFREDRQSPESSEIIHGCKFNPTYSSFAMNHTISLAYGYLNFIDIFFPSFNTQIDDDLKKHIESFLTETNQKLKKNIEAENDNKFWKSFYNFIHNKEI